MVPEKGRIEFIIICYEDRFHCLPLPEDSSCKLFYCKYCAIYEISSIAIVISNILIINLQGISAVEGAYIRKETVSTN